MKTIRQTKEIRAFILNNIASPNLVAMVIERFAISRAAVYKHLNKLVADGLIVHDNARKLRKYSLVYAEHCFNYDIVQGLDESVVWLKDIEQCIPAKKNVFNIWMYCFSEMFNNAIDHSQGTKICVKVLVDVINTTVIIEDDGVGAFRNIQNKFNLLNEREAILELSKGKLTTNKARHSGEGIFFTSRAVDDFFILSHGIIFSHMDNFKDVGDVLIEAPDKDYKGTMVFMRLNNNSERVLKDVFDAFSGEDYGFDKTVIPISLARYGDDNLVSRSQAKRVLNRLDLFKNVVFDFANVPQIGQAFADEIFRVFKNMHPEIELLYINANQDVENMIRRANNVRL